MKTCSICGEQLPDKTLRRSVWKTCDNADCRREASRRKAKAYDESIRRSVDNPPPERQIKIDIMREEIGTREEFAKAFVKIGNTNIISKHYGVIIQDVAKLRNELFTENPIFIKRLGEDLLDKPKAEIVRKPIEVKVYKITDMAAIEREIAEHKFGEPVSYEGLEFDRIEYANEFVMPFNPELRLELEQEGDINAYQKTP